MYMCACVQVYTCVYVCVHAGICLRICVCACRYMPVYMFVSMIRVHVEAGGCWAVFFNHVTHFCQSFSLNLELITTFRLVGRELLGYACFCPLVLGLQM